MNPLAGNAGTFLLFVYGTLRRGGVRHGVLEAQRHLGAARTLPLYALHHLGAYPGLVETGEGGQVVHGDLYEAACDLVGRLDAVEGAPALFRLQPVQIREHPGPVWAYFYQGDVTGHPRIEAGEWKH